MALIKCPECEMQVSDKAKICIHCGYPLEEMKLSLSEEIVEDKKEITCPYCDSKDIDSQGYCNNCGMKVIGNYVIEEETNEEQYEAQEYQEFNGIYRYTLFGRQAVYCPRCGSSECSHYHEQHVIPGKTKTSYTANLNPLKPFTIANKKEKVVRREKTVTERRIICHKCGFMFY